MTGLKHLRKIIPIGREALITLGAGCAVFLFHAMHIPSVAKGVIFQKANLAFDFDTIRFVRLWGRSPFPEAWNDGYYAVRHPLAISVRLLCTLLVGVGIDPHVAACGIAALCAALSTVVTYKIARAIGVHTPIACAFAALWSVSTTTLILGVLPEAYGLALVALAYQFLLAIRWMLGHPASQSIRISVATANFGITITNVILSGLAELVCRIARDPCCKALRGTIGFSIRVGLVAVFLSIVSLSVWPSHDINGVTSVLKELYGSATLVHRKELRQGLGNVAWEFGATAFVAPAIARYPSYGPADNPYLWDFRGQNYSSVGWAAVLGWLALLAYGAATAVKDRERWPIWALAAAWIVFNVGLHTYWQTRGSVFMYAAHPQMAFLMLALAGASRTRYPHIYGALVVLVVLLVALNNMPIYLTLSKLN